MGRAGWGLVLLVGGILLVFVFGPAVGGPIAAYGFWLIIGLVK